MTANSSWSLLNVDSTKCWMSFWFGLKTAYYNFSTTNFRNWWMVLLISNANTTHQIWLGASQRLGMRSYAWPYGHSCVRRCARDYVEALYEITCVDFGWGPWEFFHGGRICVPGVINSLLECPVKWSCCVVQQNGGLSVATWKIQLQTNSGEGTEPVSWKFVFGFLECFFRIKRRFAGPAMRIVRESFLGEETLVVS